MDKYDRQIEHIREARRILEESRERRLREKSRQR